MGLFSSIAGIFGGNRKKKALGRANEGYQTRLGEAQDYSKSLFDPINAGLSPVMGLATQGAGALSNLLGLGGGDMASVFAGLKESPIYQSLMHNGEEAVLQNASATGGLRGGNVQHSLAGLGTDVLAKTYQMMVDNLMGATELGSKTGLGLGALGGDQARLNAQLQKQKADAQADALTGRANVAAGMYGDYSGIAGTIANAATGNFGAGGGGMSGFFSDIFKAF